MYYCHRGVLVKTYDAVSSIETMPCRCWHCDKCRRRRRLALIQLGVDGAPDMLLTLTISAKTGEGPADRAQRLAKGWRKLRRWIMEVQGYEQMPFLAVFEEHKSGEPHLHILCRSDYIPRDDLVEKWIALTGSWNVDIRRVENTAKGIKYICKYIGKNPERFEGTKRYWRSQDWLEDAPIADLADATTAKGIFRFGWIESIVAEYEAQGFVCEWTETSDTAWCLAPHARAGP